MARTKALPRPSGAIKTSRKSMQHAKHLADRKQQIGGGLPRPSTKTLSRKDQATKAASKSAPGPITTRKPVRHSGVYNYRHRFAKEMRRQQRKGDHDLGVHNTQAQRRMIGYALENSLHDSSVNQDYLPGVSLKQHEIVGLRMKKDAISAVHDAAQDSVLTITERAFRLARMQGLVTLKPAHLAQAFWSWSQDRNPELWKDAEFLLKGTSQDAERIVHSPSWFGCTPNAECFDIYTKNERARMQRKEVRVAKKQAEQQSAPTATGTADA